MIGGTCDCIVLLYSSLRICCLSGVSVHVRAAVGRLCVRATGRLRTRRSGSGCVAAFSIQFYADRTVQNTQVAAASLLTVRQFVRPPVTLPLLGPPPTLIHNPQTLVVDLPSPPSFGTRSVTR